MLPTKFRFIWTSGFGGEDLKKSVNQKQELPVVAMFVNRSGQNKQSLESTFHRCFLPSFSSVGWEVSEENIKMWKFNGRQMTDAKWWQKLTLPLARWAKNGITFPNWMIFNFSLCTNDTNLPHKLGGKLDNMKPLFWIGLIDV